MKKSIATLLAGLVCLQATALVGSQPASSVQAADPIQVEALSRGISAVKTNGGMLVSWRYLANDANDATFRLYRDDQLIYTSKAGEATCFLDAGGSASSRYRVDTMSGETVKSTETCTYLTNNPYFQVPLTPPTGSVAYTPNDCSVGDVDGDGQYEIFLKWDPANSQDNSKSGVTDKVYIDCLKLDGTRLWRVDLGINIRAGAHYTQMLVGDFDSDGSAELVCKTSDGTVDGTGKTIGDGSKDYRNSSGYILTGNEFLTLFDGMTGKALDTINYNPARGNVSDWGDKYGNRVDRFLGAVMYLDASHPSAVTVRGYYTRMTACAYDVVDKKLKQRWFYDSGSDSAKGFGNGNHNCMPADVDGDGRQELVLGATCIDDNGKLLWCRKTGHGDAMHLGDFLPERNGLELWLCHEAAPYGWTLADAATGATIFHYDNSKDTGRCCADNVWAGNAGAEFWGNSVYNGAGQTLSCNRPSINFLCYWDGDLERNPLDGGDASPATIYDMGKDGKLTGLLTTDGALTCNSTKATPCLSADLFGDWREEVVMRSSDSRSLRIYATPYSTQYRLTTLMQDPQYRMQVAGENICYNQPPHASFYLGSEAALPARPNVIVNGAELEPIRYEGQLIQEMIIADRTNGGNWSIAQNLAVGSKLFGDRDFTYTNIPTAYLGAEYIMTACNSKTVLGDLATVTAGADTTLYVALDSRVAEVPAWLGSWTKTNDALLTSNDLTMVLYAKDVAKGETVTLGTNGGSTSVVNYTAFAMQKNATLLGDVNLDGVVDKLDVLMLQSFLGAERTLSDESAKQADLSGDHQLSTVDLTLLKRLLLH